MKIIVAIALGLMFSHMLMGTYGYRLGFKDASLKASIDNKDGRKYIEKVLQECVEEKDKYEHLFNHCKVLLKGPN